MGNPYDGDSITTLAGIIGTNSTTGKLGVKENLNKPFEICKGHLRPVLD
jgi:hypothetical protein